MKYPHDPINAFSSGAILDLEARIAVDALRQSPIFMGAAATMKADEVARYALDLMGAFLREAESRGLVAPLPDDAKLSAPVKRHYQRCGAANVAQQEGLEKAAQELRAGALVTARPQGIKLDA